jgi:D-lyxose ketol-isomerase
MKRSEINRILREAEVFLRAQKITLPPFCGWTPEQWRDKGPEYDEIRVCRLGWDVTDFGGGDFYGKGLVLVTLRNGSLSDPRFPKPYAEKLLIIRHGQVCPLHFHWNKTEDIFNRGGGRLCMDLWHATSTKVRDLERPIHISQDGEALTLEPGVILTLAPGQGVTLPAGLYHRFWAENAATLLGEVSTPNDDDIDNHFRDPMGRFPPIEEDEAPYRLLCTEYPKPGAC